MKVWHGTTTKHKEGILRDGLKPANASRSWTMDFVLTGIGIRRPEEAIQGWQPGSDVVWITNDRESAGYYAARAVALELLANGQLWPADIPLGLAVELEVDRDRIDFLPYHEKVARVIWTLPGGCDPVSIVSTTAIDVSDQVRAFLARARNRGGVVRTLQQWSH